MSRDAPLVLGVDFTSAPSRRKPITVAVGRLVEGRRAARYVVEAIRGLESLDAFAALLRADGPWIGGFDLPFSQPRSLIEREGWPTAWPAFVDFYCRRPREQLRRTFKRWCDARPAGDKVAHRACDATAGSRASMKWVNPPVARMLHAGAARLLDAGLTLPGLHERGTDPARVGLEGYPGLPARAVLGRASYK
ncbi:MAG: DUF429 domain-containing protein, partial [Planctomycetia bacterium]